MTTALLPYDTAATEGMTAELDLWRARIDARGPLVRSWDGRLRRDLEAESVAASTRMEGVRVTAEEVRRILAGDTPPTVSAQDAALVAGYRDAMTYVLRRADDPSFAWTRELVVGLQDRVLGGSYAQGAGRFRRGATTVIDQRTGDVVFAPPEAGELPALVDRALAQLRASDAHVGVAAAWIHVAIAAIHPFRDGNGRTSRVLSSLAMYRGGFKRPEFCSLEEWWGRHLADYYGAFGCLGRRFDPSADVTPFILAHLSAQVAQVRALHREEQIGRLLWTAIGNACVDARVPDRVANALFDAFHERKVTAGYYRNVVGVSPATATNDLRIAVAARLLAPLGQRRTRSYVAGDDLYAAVRAALGGAGSAADEPTRVGILNALADTLREDGIAENDTATGRVAASTGPPIVIWPPNGDARSRTRA